MDHIAMQLDSIDTLGRALLQRAKRNAGNEERPTWLDLSSEVSCTNVLGKLTESLTHSMTHPPSFNPLRQHPAELDWPPVSTNFSPLHELDLRRFSQTKVENISAQPSLTSSHTASLLQEAAELGAMLGTKVTSGDWDDNLLLSQLSPETLLLLNRIDQEINLSLSDSRTVYGVVEETTRRVNAPAALRRSRNMVTPTIDPSEETAAQEVIIAANAVINRPVGVQVFGEEAVVDPHLALLAVAWELETAGLPMASLNSLLTNTGLVGSNGTSIDSLGALLSRVANTDVSVLNGLLALREAPSELPSAVMEFGKESIEHWKADLSRMDATLLRMRNESMQRHFERWRLLMTNRYITDLEERKLPLACDRLSNPFYSSDFSVWSWLSRAMADSLEKTKSIEELPPVTLPVGIPTEALPGEKEAPIDGEQSVEWRLLLVRARQMLEIWSAPSPLATAASSAAARTGGNLSAAAAAMAAAASQPLSPADDTIAAYHTMLTRSAELLSRGFNPIVMDRATGYGSEDATLHRAMTAAKLIAYLSLATRSTEANSTEASLNENWGPFLVVCRLREFELYEAMLTSVLLPLGLETLPYTGSDNDRTTLRSFTRAVGASGTLGAMGSGLYNSRSSVHIVLLSYESLLLDLHHFRDVWWYTCLFDEPLELLSQRYSHAVWQIAQILHTRQRVLLTREIGYLTDADSALGEDDMWPNHWPTRCSGPVDSATERGDELSSERATLVLPDWYAVALLVCPFALGAVPQDPSYGPLTIPNHRRTTPAVEFSATQPSLPMNDASRLLVLQLLSATTVSSDFHPGVRLYAVPAFPSVTTTLSNLNTEWASRAQLVLTTRHDWVANSSPGVWRAASELIGSLRWFGVVLGSVVEEAVADSSPPLLPPGFTTCAYSPPATPHPDGELVLWAMTGVCQYSSRYMRSTALRAELDHIVISAVGRLGAGVSRTVSSPPVDGEIGELPPGKVSVSGRSSRGARTSRTKRPRVESDDEREVDEEEDTAVASKRKRRSDATDDHDADCVEEKSNALTTDAPPLPHFAQEAAQYVVRLDNGRFAVAIASAPTGVNGVNCTSSVAAMHGPTGHGGVRFLGIVDSEIAAATLFARAYAQRQGRLPGYNVSEAGGQCVGLLPSDPRLLHSECSANGIGLRVSPFHTTPSQALSYALNPRLRPVDRSIPSRSHRSRAASTQSCALDWRATDGSLAGDEFYATVGRDDSLLVASHSLLYASLPAISDWITTYPQPPSYALLRSPSGVTFQVPGCHLVLGKASDAAQELWWQLAADRVAASSSSKSSSTAVPARFGLRPAASLRGVLFSYSTPLILNPTEVVQSVAMHISCHPSVASQHAAIAWCALSSQWMFRALADNVFVNGEPCQVDSGWQPIISGSIVQLGVEQLMFCLPQDASAMKICRKSPPFSFAPGTLGVDDGLQLRRGLLSTIQGYGAIRQEMKASNKSTIDVLKSLFHSEIQVLLGVTPSAIPVIESALTSTNSTAK